MKSSYKKLLSVLGALSLAVPFIGCEVDAEEAADGPQQSTNTATANLTAGSASNSPATSIEANSSTNAVIADASSSLTSTNEPVILQKIPPTLPADVKLSKPAEEVVKLAQSGVSETVILLFVEKSKDPFELDAPDIVYLNDIGIPSTVIASMLTHDGSDTDILHDALSTNNVATATAPPTQTTFDSQPAWPAATNVAQAPPTVEVSSNYVAAPQYGAAQAPIADPNAQVQQAPPAGQQTVVVQQPAVVVTQPAVTYSYFYNSLSPYGSWVYVTDYGWCWQPTIAVTHNGWRPYLHGGRWLYSDVGWYWHSDYSWGWAPFHYGRWYCAPRFGWVWTPDYTWGPSWVTWRRSGDYCGWAPLPPRAYVRPGIGFSYWGRDVGFSFSFGYSHDYYTFVPARRFCDRRVRDHVVPTERNVNIYKDSTVVNNYIVGNNNTIINNGVGRDYVARHTSEIPRVRVSDTPSATGRIAPDRIVRQGSESVVYRPQRPAPTLVAAHEAAVARTRSEVARPVSADGLSTRQNMIASRPNSSETVGAASPNVRATSPRGGSTPVARTETARRPQLAADNDVPTPVFGRPAPVRPEPDRTAEILRSRSSQQVSRPSTTPSGRVIGGTTTATPSTTARPGSTGRSEVPRFEQRPPQTSGGVVRPLPQTSARPGAPTVTSPAVPSTSTGRGEIGRGNTVQPGTPAVRPGATVPSTGSQRPVTPSTTAPRSVTPTAPAQRDGGAQPVQPRRETSRPTATLPDSGTVTRTAPAQSPAFARPARAASQQAATVAQPSPNPARSAVSSSPSASTWTRQSSIQQQVSTVPQTVQRSAPAQAPAVAAPRVIQRSESFSRPSAPAQSSPRVSVAQPQMVTPVAPQQRPSMSAPQMSSPPTRSAPSVSPGYSRPAPSQGGGYRSVPPSAPAARPSSPAPSGRDRSGRLEIGR